MAAIKKVCRWRELERDFGFFKYETACDHTEILNLSYMDAKYKYCPFCGGLIVLLGKEIPA